MPGALNEGDWSFTFEAFKQRYEANPQDLFASIDRAIEAYDDSLISKNEQIQNLTTEQDELNQKITSKDEQIDLLIAERDDYKNAFARQALQRQNEPLRSPTPEPTPKSVKLPDPLLLTDGKEPKFEDWESRMKNKLIANADHYATEILKMAYIENRTGGDAAQHLAPRLREGAANKFTTADEMFKHLENVYLDPNRLQTAKTDFRKLVMRKNDNFHEFLTKFLHLAGEANIPEDDYKYEMNTKLAFDLQKAVVTNFISSSSFNEFSAHCSQVFHTLQNIASMESRLRRPQNSGKGNTTGGQQPISTTLKEADKARLLREGRCFTCMETGHLSRDCPRKKQTTDRKPANQGIHELEADEPGKGLP